MRPVLRIRCRALETKTPRRSGDLWGVLAAVGAVQLQPLVPPHDTHFRHVPLRTRVKAPQLPHGSPS